MTETTELKRDCEVIAIPSGARQVLPKGIVLRIVQARGTSYTVSAPRMEMYRIDAADADALGLEAPASANSLEQGPLNERLVWDALKTVYDPEIPVDIVELGLIYSCKIVPLEMGGKRVDIRMAMTSPGCGMSNVLKTEVESKVQRLPEVMEARVDVVFDPPWDPSRMSEAARLQLGFDLESSRTSGLTQIS